MNDEDVAVLRRFVRGQYTDALAELEGRTVTNLKRLNELAGSENSLGTAPASEWNLMADAFKLVQEKPLSVARCTQILNSTDSKQPTRYMINQRAARMVVGLASDVAPADVTVGCRVG